jgi:hypothetical protein
MQTSPFGKAKGLLRTLTEGTWSDAFDGLSISLMLTSNPAIQVAQASLSQPEPSFVFFFFFKLHLKGYFQDQYSLTLKYHVLQYTVFDQLKNRVLANNQTIAEKGVSPASLSAFMAFLLGAVSKSIATCLTYPAIRYIIVPSNLFRSADLVSTALLRSFFYLRIGAKS